MVRPPLDLVSWGVPWRGPPGAPPRIFSRKWGGRGPPFGPPSKKLCNHPAYMIEIHATFPFQCNQSISFSGIRCLLLISSDTRLKWIKVKNLFNGILQSYDHETFPFCFAFLWCPKRTYRAPCRVEGGNFEFGCMEWDYIKEKCLTLVSI